MKKISIFLALIISVLLLFSSCGSVTVLNSAEAKTRLEEMGYSVDIVRHGKEDASNLGVKQVTILNAKKGEDFLQVYYFTDEEDTEIFFNLRANSIMEGVDIAKKNKYSIYRGTEQAVDDFLVK